ncbi:MAG: hypothetical protein FJ161_02920, partial [Gammaproteobacteria bacterium]|nr:hypothetical protein [Gammaproteobacteria bacterium]
MSFRKVNITHVKAFLQIKAYFYHKNIDKTRDRYFDVVVKKLQEGTLAETDVEVIDTVRLHGKLYHVYSIRANGDKRVICMFVHGAFWGICYTSDHDKTYDTYNGMNPRQIISHILGTAVEYIENLTPEQKAEADLNETPLLGHGATPWTEADEIQMLTAHNIRSLIELSGEQAEILKNVSAEEGAQGAYIEGTPGSGKTLIGIESLIKTIGQYLERNKDYTTENSQIPELHIAYCCTASEVINDVRKIYQERVTEEMLGDFAKYIHVDFIHLTAPASARTRTNIETWIEREAKGSTFSPTRLFHELVNFHGFNGRWSDYQRAYAQKDINHAELKAILEKHYGTFQEYLSDNPIEGVSLNREDFKSGHYDLVVLDEAHNISLPMSKAIVELTNPGYLLVLGQDAQGFA